MTPTRTTNVRRRWRRRGTVRRGTARVASGEVGLRDVQGSQRYPLFSCAGPLLSVYAPGKLPGAWGLTFTLVCDRLALALESRDEVPLVDGSALGNSRHQRVEIAVGRRGVRRQGKGGAQLGVCLCPEAGRLRRRDVRLRGELILTHRAIHVGAGLKGQGLPALPAPTQAQDRAHGGGTQPDQRAATRGERSPHFSPANCRQTRGGSG